MLVATQKKDSKTSIQAERAGISVHQRKTLSVPVKQKTHCLGTAPHFLLGCHPLAVLLRSSARAVSREGLKA